MLKLHTKAIESFVRCIESAGSDDVQPDHFLATALCGRGQFLLELEQYQDATVSFAWCIDLKSAAAAAAFACLAQAFLRNQDPEQVLRDLDIRCT